MFRRMSRRFFNLFSSMYRRMSTRFRLISCSLSHRYFVVVLLLWVSVLYCVVCFCCLVAFRYESFCCVMWPLPPLPPLLFASYLWKNGAPGPHVVCFVFCLFIFLLFSSSLHVLVACMCWRPPSSMYTIMFFTYIV